VVKELGFPYDTIPVAMILTRDVTHTLVSNAYTPHTLKDKSFKPNIE
jgi:hypothetical protein